MKTLLGLIAYMAIGGLLCTPVLLSYEKQCRVKMSISDFADVVLVWPAILVGTLYVDSDKNSSCSSGEGDANQGDGE